MPKLYTARASAPGSGPGKVTNSTNSAPTGGGTARHTSSSPRAARASAWRPLQRDRRAPGRAEEEAATKATAMPPSDARIVAITDISRVSRLSRARRPRAAAPRSGGSDEEPMSEANR